MYIKKYLKAILFIYLFFTENQIIYHAKIKSSKNPFKKTKILKAFYNSIIPNLKFQHKENPQIKIDLLLLTSMGQNPLSYYTL
jgi:hypothetical protein